MYMLYIGLFDLRAGYWLLGLTASVLLVFAANRQRIFMKLLTKSSDSAILTHRSDDKLGVSTLDNVIGKHIKNCRKALKLSLKQLGDSCGVSDSEILKIESGQRKNPSWITLCKIAKGLNTHPFEFMYMAGYINKSDIHPVLKLKGLERLSVENLEIVQGVIDKMISQNAKKKSNVKKFKMGELFCGPGGLAWGAIHAKIENDDYGIVHAWANDRDEDTCKTYVRNICHDKPESVYCEDVRTLDIEKLGDIDAFSFGFPCNDFSVVGEQKGFEGTYGALYTYGINVLRRYQPLWFLAENVGGLKSANEGGAFAKIKEDMIDCGYRIYPNLYKFEEYGVPQARHRVIIVGIRNDLPYEFRIPSPEPYAEDDISCKTAIENPPIALDAPNNEQPKMSAQVVKRLHYIKPGENAFTADLPEELQLNIKGAKISQIYKRLDPNKPAYTVTGSGGGGTHIYHWSEDRALTNRERARLQTFTDDFVFEGSKESVRKQIGMAVPCHGAQIIYEAILRTFAEIPYESIEANIEDE